MTILLKNAITIDLMAFLQRNLAAVICTLVLSSIYFGNALNANADEMYSTDVAEKTLDWNGTEAHYKLTQGLSPENERQVIIEHEEKRPLLPTTSVPVLIGRDLDGDGRFDAWFYVGDDGEMNVVDLPSQTEDGWDAAEAVLRQHTNPENRWLAAMMFDSLTGFMTFSGSYKLNLRKSATLQEIELRDIEVRTERLKKQGGDPHELLWLYEQLSDGWGGIAEQIKDRDAFAVVGEDLLLGLLAEGFTWGFKILGRQVSRFVARSELVAALGELYSRYVAQVESRIAEAAENIRFLKRFGLETATRTSAVAEYMRMSIQDRMALIIKGLEARGAIGRFVLKSGSKVKPYALTFKERILYMTQTQLIQLGTEIKQDWDVLYDPNPIVMAQKVLSDRDLLQDMLYMTNETVGTTVLIRQSGSGLKALGIAGIYSSVDSSVMNYWVRGTTDYTRATGDTLWELAIGNVQTVVDQHSLDFFLRLSQKAEDPRLRFVGYAARYVATGADQLLGYMLYGKASHYYEKHEAEIKDKEKKLKKLILTPIFAPNG